MQYSEGLVALVTRPTALVVKTDQKTFQHRFPPQRMTRIDETTPKAGHVLCLQKLLILAIQLKSIPVKLGVIFIASSVIVQ
jgi:hypothetical protein